MAEVQSVVAGFQYWELAKIIVFPLAIIGTQKFFDYKNEKEHDALRSMVSSLGGDISKVIAHFELNIENSTYIATMGDIKTHYISRFRTRPFRIAANEKANVFIMMIAKTIKDHPDMSSLSWTSVMQDLDTGFESVKNMMKSHLADEIVESFYGQYVEAYRLYKVKVEGIFLGLDNARKERFIKMSNEFMIEFLAALVDHEKMVPVNNAEHVGEALDEIQPSV